MRNMLWFNFILGLSFICFCFKHYHTLPYPKQKNIKIKPRTKSNHNIQIHTRHGDLPYYYVAFQNFNNLLQSVDWNRPEKCKDKNTCGITACAISHTKRIKKMANRKFSNIKRYLPIRKSAFLPMRNTANEPRSPEAHQESKKVSSKTKRQKK